MLHLRIVPETRIQLELLRVIGAFSHKLNTKIQIKESTGELLGVK